MSSSKAKEKQAIKDLVSDLPEDAEDYLDLTLQEEAQYLEEYLAKLNSVMSKNNDWIKIFNVVITILAQLWIITELWSCLQFVLLIFFQWKIEVPLKFLILHLIYASRMILTSSDFTVFYSVIFKIYEIHIYPYMILKKTLYL